MSHVRGCVGFWLWALVGAGVVDGGSKETWLAGALRPAEAPAELFAADAHFDPRLLLTPLLEEQ